MPSRQPVGRAARILDRGCRLRCPRCGGTRLFTGWFAMARACAFPLWFFRYSRSLWLAIEYTLNPEH